MLSLFPAMISPVSRIICLAVALLCLAVIPHRHNCCIANNGKVNHAWEDAGILDH